MIPSTTDSVRSPSRKIVIVGGGSYNWCPRLLCDLVQCPELTGSEVVLLDPNISAATEVKSAMDRVCADHKKDFRFGVTQKEDEAFRNASFVIIAISTGGLETMRHDLEIPERYSIYQTVGDSVGPGGWARLLRNVPVFVKMVEKIERLAPQAVILNYTNPMAGLTAAITQTTSLRSVGLCHGVFGTLTYLSRVFQVPKSEICMRFGGINHFFWILDFKVNGKDGYPLLRETLGTGTLLRYDKTSKDPAGFSDYNHAVFSELFETYGHLTYSADRHTCEFFNRYVTDLKTIHDYKLVRTTIADRQAGVQTARQLTLDLASGKVPMLARSVETAVDIIKAITTNTPFVDVVNLPNLGQIDNLPRGAVVETLGMVDGRGFSPIAVGPLPEILRQISEIHCQIQKMTLEAALSGNRKLAMEALLLDPLCSHLSPTKIREMGTELMSATADFLPQFR